VVSVTASGEIRINKETVPKHIFAHKLRRVLAAKQQRIVFFDAEADAPFGTDAEAIDLARGGGAATIAVLTRPMAKR
jgi:biopolymer transport protein ExbD